MATLLFRLGRFAYRRAVPVLVAWVLAAAAAVGAGIALGPTMQDSYEIPGTEAQEAIDLLAAVFPQTAGASAQVIVHDPAGADLERTRGAEIQALVDDLAAVGGIEQAVSPFSEYATEAVSGDRDTAIVQVQFSASTEDVSEATLDELRAAVEPHESGGLDIVLGGTVFEQFEFGLTVIELLGVIFAALVLVVAFGSFIAAGLPLLTAFLGLGTSMGLVLVTAAFTTISSTTPMLALMIGLAVGIDYALFILSRHRQQLASGMDAEESAATSVATAGGSVVFAGLTVVVALAGLLVVGIPFLGVMGVAAAGAVVAAMLTAVTALPALMGLLGRRLTPRSGPRAARRGPSGRSLGERWVRAVVRAPLVAILGVVAVLGTLAIPAFSLELALPTGAQQPEGSEQREAYDLVSEEFGPGHNGPLIVTVDITQTTEIFERLEAIADELGGLPGVVATSDGIPNESLDTGIIQVIPATGPTDPETTELVQAIRALAPELERRYDTALAVTGTTAVMIDISQRLDAALLPFGILVVGLSVILLAIVFRSILVPIKAALGYLLSVLAGFGVVVAVFQWGWGAELLHTVPGPILSFMPVLLMAILFGLAMDYEVFLVSGMREHYVHRVAGRALTPAQQNTAAREAVVHGFAGAARVVTAAALIMFFVFAAFVPEGMAVIKVIALGLAVGIAADAFLVRMTLVPAVMALAGRWAWRIPRRLDRMLPDVDVEGARLAEHRAAVDWAASRLDAGEAITLDDLVVGEETAPAGRYTMSVPRGAIALLEDVEPDPVARRLLCATIAGRLRPAAGHGQVLGAPLRSEASRVARRVALGDVAAARDDAAVTFGELLDERIRVTGANRRGRARVWIERAGAALKTSGRTGSLHRDVPLAALPQLDRAVALAVVAFAEETPVVLLGAADPFARPEDAVAFLTALDRLAPAGTTVVVGVPGLEPVAGNRIHLISRREGVAR